MTPRVTLARLFPLLLALGIPATPLAAQTPGVEQRRTLEVAGARRGYLLYLPSSWQRGRPVPLVLVFHGAGGRSAGMARHTGFSRVAEREGFAVVYPDGVGRRWNDGRGIGGARDDVGFVRALVDSLERELGIDRRRVYATGISNGAMFAHRLACDLPGVLAAIAPVAGAAWPDWPSAAARQRRWRSSRSRAPPIPSCPMAAVARRGAAVRCSPRSAAPGSGPGSTAAPPRPMRNRRWTR
jgi:poly(3-hydroxybutyrate) depolymerase